MDKHIVPAGLTDESESFGIVEPLDRTLQTIPFHTPSIQPRTMPFLSNPPWKDDADDCLVG